MGILPKHLLSNGEMTEQSTGGVVANFDSRNTQYLLDFTERLRLHMCSLPVIHIGTETVRPPSLWGLYELRVSNI